MLSPSIVFSTPLPIDTALPAVRDALRDHPSVVLHAPPGAGKTTRVPLALLHEPWLAGQRIIMLEPRRLATRAAARHMAATLGERVGETVGYRVRMDTQVSARTRIEVVTEGILTRMVQHDPALESIGLVIFDEFHERNLNADLGLALTLHSQRLLRDDLRILVMSATLDTAGIARLLGRAPVVAIEGRSFPVDVRYVERRSELRMEAAVTNVIRRAVTHDDGDLLVFLPGAGEIHRVASMLDDGTLPSSVRIAPLYGNLSADAQDLAIAPSPPGQRKIVLATSIAETSLTIEGVRVVIDSGLMRVPRFSPRSGMTRLETVRVSRASANQRCGRAGRLGPGICYRLWAEHEQHHLVPHGTPEILDADLAPLALELAAAGIRDPATLPWLDVPPTAAYAHARTLLAQLGALDAADATGRITPHGQRMAELAMHPRLAHMLVEGTRLGHGALACIIAAMLHEKDILRAEDSRGTTDADIRLRVQLLAGMVQASSVHGHVVDRHLSRRVMEEARLWQRQLRIDRNASIDLEACGVLLAFAYPDRIAQRRSTGNGRFILRNGRGAALMGAQPLSNADYLVVADLDGASPDSRIFLAAEVSRADLETHFGAQITTETVVAWDETTQSVRSVTRTQLGAIVLKEVPLRNVDPTMTIPVVLDAIRRIGLTALPWTDAARRTQARLQFLHQRDADDSAWPDVTDATLLATLDTWLAPHLDGITSLEQLQQIELGEVLLSPLSWEQRRALDDRAPTHLEVPTGSRIPIDYSDPTAPVLAVRLQEMFGVQETPRIDRGTVPLTLHLLSPAHRPVQITRDLGGFWRTSYHDVKKEMKGRYPKHVWPDDPISATPTRRAKPRGE